MSNIVLDETQLGRLWNKCLNTFQLRSEKYPVGAIYISTDSTSPASLFGGSWTRIEGKFLLGTSMGTGVASDLASLGYDYNSLYGDYYTYVNKSGTTVTRSITPGKIGYSQTSGEVSHKLTVAELPSHSHSYYDYYTLEPYSVGSDRHAVCYDQHTSTSTTTETTKSAGSGFAHNNMPPYLLVYIWKRTV